MQNASPTSPECKAAQQRAAMERSVPYRGEEAGTMVGCLAPEPTEPLGLPRRGERMEFVAMLRRDLDGAGMLLRFAAPQFVRSGSCAELRIEEAVDAQQLAFLVDAHRHNRDLAIECAGLFTSSKARVDGMSSWGVPGGGYRVKLLIKAILSSSAPPPYAVGDEVEWRAGPLDTSWRPGRVMSIVDDRPDDGIDKPFWIVRVDALGERRFAGPALAVCLRHRQNDTPQAVMERRIGRSLDVPLPCARCGVVYAPEALDGAQHCNGCATAMRGRPTR